jgi:thiol:disulfide interchange protein DsbD
MTRALLAALVALVVGCAAPHPDTRPANAAKAPTGVDPVAVSVRAARDAVQPGDTFEVTVVLDVSPPFEIYAQDAPPPGVPTRVVLTLPEGFSAPGQWSAPHPVPSQSPDGHRVYDGRVELTREVTVGEDVAPGPRELTCAVRYQACDAFRCLTPKSVELHLPVTVRAK